MFSAPNLSLVDRDFGVFSQSSSPPREVLNNYKPSFNHTPISMSRSANSLSPVHEGNEEDNGGSLSLRNPVFVPVIATSAAPSETFLKLTISGVFKNPAEEPLDVVDLELAPPDGDRSPKIGNNLSYITQNIGPRTGLSGDPSDASLKQDEHQQETVLQDDSEVETKDTSDATVPLDLDQSDPPSPITSDVKLSTTVNSPFTRPKIRSNNLKVVSPPKQQTKKASPKPRRLPGSRFASQPSLPSVEQAVHRERVNSLPLPASPKPTLKKIGPPSITAQATSSTSRKPTTSKDNIPVAQKISPPHAPPKNSNRKTSVPNLASPHPRSNNGTPQRKISPPNLPLPKSNPSRKITPPRMLKVTTPSHLEKPQRRKSLPDIILDHSQASTCKSITVSRPVGSPKLSPRPVPPRRKISEPCFPFSPLPSTSPSDPQRGGIFSDPRYNPMIVTPKTTNPDLARKYAEKWRVSVDNRPLAKLSSPDSEGSVTKTRSSFDDDEYEKLKNCRYIRRAAWNMNDDVPNA